MLENYRKDDAVLDKDDQFVVRDFLKKDVLGRTVIVFSYKVRFQKIQFAERISYTDTTVHVCCQCTEYIVVQAKVVENAILSQ